MKKINWFYGLLSLLFALIDNELTAQVQIGADSLPIYQDGKLYLKIKSNSNAAIYKKDSITNDISGQIQIVFNKYNVTKTEKPFAILNDAKLNKTYRITYVSTLDVENFINELQQINSVEYAEKVPAMYTSAVPNDPMQPYHLPLVKANLASNIHISNGNAIVAIVDDAVLTTHEDLAANIGTINRDVANLDNNPNPPLSGGNSITNSNFTHGTIVSGVAGGVTNNGVGIASVGWNNKLMCVKVSPDAGISQNVPFAYDGLAWAGANGAHVINMSWGGFAPSQTDYNVVVAAKSNNIVLVASAGNSYSGLAKYPAAYGEGHTNQSWEILNKRLVIAVAAIDANNDISIWGSTTNATQGSNFGPWIDISAYGTGILSTVGNSSAGTPINNQYIAANGTSFAAPIVSGIAGIMRSYNMSKTADEIIDCLLYTANPDIYNSSTHPSNISGTLGTGRVDAEAALRCLGVGCTNPIAVIMPSSQNLCPGGNVTLTANQGQSYLWSNGATTQATNITTPGTYGLTVNFAGGCTASTNITINIAPSNASISISDQSGLLPGDGYMCGRYITGVFASYGLSYQWNVFGGVTAQGISPIDPSTTPLPFNLNNVCVTVSGVGGCVGVNSTACVNLHWLPLPVVNLSANPTSLTCPGLPVNLTASGTINYEWGSPIASHSPNPTTVYPYATTTYDVTGTDANGCTASAQTIVNVNSGPFDIPFNTQITGNVTWNQPLIKVDGLVVVNPGANLTITGTTRVEFSHHADILDPMPTGVTRLVVMPGGNLTIDPNVTMTGCSGGIWDGIELWGTGIFNTGASFATIKGKIENADIGIFTSRRPKKNQAIVNAYGGLFTTTGAQFINNKVAIKMPRSANSSACTINTSSFSFNGTSPYFADFNLANNVQAIHIDAGNNVNFTANANTFTGGSTAYSPELRGTAIKCEDCLGTITGNNTFTGHARAISAEYLFTNNQLVVTGATISNNQEGIYMQVSSLAVINNVTFQIPPPVAPFTKTYGIFAVSSNGFNISTNLVNPATANSNSYGMVFENTGVTGGVVFNNSFGNIGVGIQAQKDNQNLKVGCNYFFNPTVRSIAVVNVTGFPTSLMKQQGSDCAANGRPAGNEWPYSCNASTSDANVFTDAGVTFKYYSYKATATNQPFTKPLCSTTIWESADMVPYICAALQNKDASSCNTIFALPPAPPSTPYSSYYNAIKNLIALNQSQISILEPKLKTALANQDGGNTQNLLNLINQTPALNPAQLKNLLTNSGALSDVVMIALINRNPSVPPGILKEILSKQIPLSVNVLTSLENFGLPNGIKNQIYNAQTNTPFYTKASTIEGQIQNLKGDVILLESEFQRTRIKETTKIGREDAKLFADASSKMLLTQDYAAKNETDSVRIVLSDLQNDSTMNLTEKQNFVSYMSTIADMLDNDETIITTGNSEVSTIQNIASTNTKAGVHANAALKERKLPHHKYFIADLSLNNMRIANDISDNEVENTILANSGSFKIYPNPNSGNFKITLNENNQSQEPVSVSISNLLGQVVYTKTVYTKTVNSTTNSDLEINTDHLTKGVYIINLVQNNNSVGQSKLIIE